MENIVLTVHLLLAVALIALVLLQRSEGGGLGLGGGGGGVMSGRQAANAMTRITWILAAAFLITSLALTLIATRNVSNGSVIDQLGLSVPSSSSTSTGAIPAIPTLPQPSAGQPVTPPAPQAPADDAAAPATAN